MYIYKLGYGGLDNNGAALMLAMGVPLCYFAWEGIRRWFRWAFLAMIPLILHAVLMSYSRGAMVSLIASVPFYLLRARCKVQLVLILAGIAVLIPVLAGKEIRRGSSPWRTRRLTPVPTAGATAWPRACASPRTIRSSAWAFATPN